MSVKNRKKSKSSIKKRKKSFTLLEVLISLVFVSLIFTFLLHTFFSSIKMTNKIHLIEKKFNERFHLHQKLSVIFSKTSLAYEFCLEHNESPFFLEEKSGNPSLNFIFFEELDFEKDFTGPLKGSLKIENGDLILEVTPYKLGPGIKRKQILASNVKSICYSFLKPNSAVMTQENEAKENLVFSWKEKTLSLPYMMKITLVKNESKADEYAFFLSQKPQPLYYK